ncbi:hypothetical protein VH570_01290 [Sphingobium sp. HT1-2]|uniref:hypothetical protein n=1 Tax=Sphingobium sp. HT1-2 TaxID=3111640 RepID=UPI003C080143
MTAITLETLRADFSKSVRELLAVDMCQSSVDHYAEITWLKNYEFVAQHPEYRADFEQVDAALFDRHYLLANVILVAEKHGLEAAMLYKLSDGAIDPRVQL